MSFRCDFYNFNNEPRSTICIIYKIQLKLKLLHFFHSMQQKLLNKIYISKHGLYIYIWTKMEITSHQCLDMLNRDTLHITNFFLILDCKNYQFYPQLLHQKCLTPSFYSIFLIAGYLAQHLRSSVKLYLVLLSWCTLQ